MSSEGDDPQASSAPQAERQFHGWRLLGFLAILVIATAVVSAIVDLMVIPR